MKWTNFVRGDIYRLKAPRNATGHEQRGTRYAIEVQADYLPLATLLVVPTSTSARAAPHRPEIDVHGTVTRVCVEQMTAVDSARLGEQTGRLSFDELTTVEDALRAILDLR